ncbi:CBS domain-containing protein [Desulforudis sp. 1088]|uniref:CBS domain-containing protein n=1 Tax=unclassified Candidatus Desulforudis TaxID=2635950 RepID=UPI003CE517FB
MASEKRAGDLARPLAESVKVGIGMSLKEVVEAMYKAGKPQRALVVDPQGRPIGLLTLRSLFEALEPGYSRVSDWPIPLFWEGLFTERCGKSSDIGIEEVVIPIGAAAVQAGDSLMQVIYSFRQSKLNCLAVFDGQNLVGLLDEPAVFGEIARAVTGDGL